uniref:Uncharacterized protein n=1 Tax=Spongospora subterranea TaxID=70186 RepID=A0A0H5RBQ1_9EUKA|eukprot:CRZ05894.1 hypothetical protein [Spongospora subterranea]
MDGAMSCGHISRCREHIRNLEMFEENERPTIGGVGGDRIKVHGRGEIVLYTASGTYVTITAGFAPDAIANLFAIRAALSKLGDGAEHRETIRSSKIMVRF